MSNMTSSAVEPMGASRPAETSPATLGTAIGVFSQHNSVRLLCLLALLTIIVRLQQGAVLSWEPLIPLITLLVWPLVEWLIHVHMLHYQPITIFGKKIDFLLPQTHRAHHRDPWNLKLVFIPPHIFPLVTPLIAGILYLLFPLQAALTSFATIMLFALHYEWSHYLAHIRYCPSISYYQKRVREHRMHHFLDEKQWWGVSMGSGDRLLGTAPNRETVTRSSTTRTLNQPLPSERAYRLMDVTPPAQ